METANPSGAVEVTDVDSAAQAIVERMNDEPTEIQEEITEETTDEVEAEESEPVELEEEPEEEADKVESDDQEAEEESEETSFQSIDELAEALDITPEEFLEQIKGKVKINGEEMELSLSELTSGYQREKDYRHKTMELAEKRKAFEESAQQKTAELEQRVQEAANIVANLEHALMSEFESVDWQTLRAENPSEYAALSQDYQNRMAQINAFKTQTTQESARMQQEAQVEQQNKLKEVIQKEREALLNVIPEWKDNTIASKAQKELRGFLHEYGFNENEINAIYDHRHVLLIRDAMKSRQVSKAAEVAKKKVKTVPKLVKPGKKQTKAEIKRATDTAKLKSFKNSGKVEDAAALILDRMS